MTADTGFITAWFDGSEQTMEAFRRIAAQTDRQNRFSCGLSWLDDLDCEDQVESESISYDSIGATREFLEELRCLLPGLRFGGHLEHCWPVLPVRQTTADFSVREGRLQWEEHCGTGSPGWEDTLAEPKDGEEWEPDIPLTPFG